jgi:hypothetical protein
VSVRPTAHPAPFVWRVRASNYRSIAACDVGLGALTVPLLVRNEFGRIEVPSGTIELPLAVPGRSSRLRLPASAIAEDAP